MDIEQIELTRHQAQIENDVMNLVEKYRTIFGWDVPENDEKRADQLIFAALRKALDELESKTSG